MEEMKIENIEIKEEFQEEIKGHFSIMMNGKFVSEQMEVPSHADLEIIPVKQEGHFTIKMEILGKETIIEIKINPKMQLNTPCTEKICWR